jgi:uncharacterized membrane protein YidH (DUF202 family)
MTEVRTGRAIVGQLADVLSIIAAIFGVLTFALAAFGKNPFTAWAPVVLPAAIAFGVVGLIAIGTAIARNHRPEAALDEHGRATTRTLIVAGVILLVFAIASVLLLVVHPAAGACAIS